MKITIAQLAPKLGDKKYNLNKIEDVVSGATSDMIIFPEMMTTGYMLDMNELEKLAEPIIGETVGELKIIAQKYSSVLVVGMPEKCGDKIFNTAIVVGPTGLIAKHQKTHLFLEEKLKFAPGENAPVLFEWQGVKIGLGICYDYMFPEYWRNLALKGAQIFINPANFVFNYGFFMMRARAIENGVFVFCVNRTGVERGNKFFGDSEAVDNRGNVLYKAGKNEVIKTITIDPENTKNKKWNEYNDLFLDRRPELY